MCISGWVDEVYGYNDAGVGTPMGWAGLVVTVAGRDRLLTITDVH